MEIRGKVAIVTGSGQGIGRGIALTLAGAGADVVVVEKNEEALAKAKEVSDEIKRMGSKSIALLCDVRLSDQVEKMISKTVSEFNQLDILINNAGVGFNSFLEKTSEEIWDLTMDVNVKGQFLCCKAAIPEIRKQGRGKIINIASVAGKTGYANCTHYCASKFASIGLTNSLAKELTIDEIQVNAICPGFIRTEFWDKLIINQKQPDETDNQTFNRIIKASIPQGRPQTPEDIGELALFLIRNDNITGQAINVDGGLELH